MKLNREQIGSGRIKRALHINGKWKVSVLIEGQYYSFRIDGESSLKTSDLSDLIYKQLLLTDVKEDVTSLRVTDKEDIVDTTPTEKR